MCIKIFLVKFTSSDLNGPDRSLYIYLSFAAYTREVTSKRLKAKSNVLRTFNIRTPFLRSLYLEKNPLNYRKSN